MSQLHVRHIKSRLTQIYNELIDLSDVNENERESSFLSRALAAFALSIYSDISPEDAAKCVTDGYKDNGVDAIYYDRNFKALYIVQSKWIQNGNGSIALDASLKLTKGVEDIINENLGRFNDKVQKKAKEIYTALEDPNTKIYLVLAYTGQQELSEPVKEHFDTFFKRVTGARNLGPFDTRDFPVACQQGESRNESQSIHRGTNCPGPERGGNRGQEGRRAAA